MMKNLRSTILLEVEEVTTKGALMQTFADQNLSDTDGDLRRILDKLLFHMSVKTIGRSSGRCAAVTASYRSGCAMYAEDGTKLADYRNRKGVMHTEIVAPAIAPKWAYERNRLWLEAAKAETRCNSIEAREFEVALPSGLSIKQAVSLAKIFATALVEKHGFVVDFSMHQDSRKNWDGSDKNTQGYHVHFLATTRRISEHGFTEKTRELDVKSAGLVKFWRETWEVIANGFLRDHGINARIDHRSNKDQKIAREATKHLGPKITALERRGVRTARGDHIRVVLPASSKVHRTDSGAALRSKKNQPEQ